MSRLLLGLAVLLSSFPYYGAAQEPGDRSGAELYRNPEYRLSLGIPTGWKIASKEEGQEQLSNKPFLVLVPTTPDQNAATISFRAVESPEVTGFDVDAASQFLNGYFGNKSVDQHMPTATWISGLRWDRVRFITFSGTNKLYAEVIPIAVREYIILIEINSTSSMLAIENADDALRKSLMFIPDYSIPEDELDKSEPIVRVSQGVLSGQYKSKRQPKYPPEAIASRIQGDVQMHAILSRAGKVEQIWVLRGEPALIQSALDAVKEWSVKPFKLNGVAVRLDTQIDVRFQLKRSAGR
jgi:TonB family protein